MTFSGKLFTIFLLVLLNNFLCYGQDKAERREIRDEASNEWSGIKPTLRLGLGMQSSFFTEIGIGGQKYHYNDEKGLKTQSLFAAFEWVPTIGHFDSRDVYGWKAGYEFTYSLFATGIEAKYQTRKDVDDYVITPKVGLGLFGVVNLFYGYNISLKGRPFEEVEQHYISLIFSLNKDMISAAKPSR